MAKNKNQHFVPQYYLHGFAQNQLLAILDLEQGREFTNTVKSAAYRKDFYDIDPLFLSYYFETNNRGSRQFVDETIRNYNETLLAPFIKMFESYRAIYAASSEKEPIKHMHTDDKGLVDFFIFQYFRTEKFGRNFEEPASLVIEMCRNKQLPLEQMTKPKRVRDEMQSIFLTALLTKLNYGPRNIYPKKLLDGFKEWIAIGEILKNELDRAKKVIVFCKENQHLLTSDNPAHIKLRDGEFDTGYVPINKGTGIFFLNKKFHPEYDDPYQEIRLVDEIDEYSIVKNLNCILVKNSSRFIYGNDDRHFPYVREYIAGKFSINLIL
jgi:hypothetical protein